MRCRCSAWFGLNADPGSWVATGLWRPLTSHNTEQSKWGSNPRLRLERAVRFLSEEPVASLLIAARQAAGANAEQRTAARPPGTPYGGIVGRNVRFSDAHRLSLLTAPVIVVDVIRSFRDNDTERVWQR